MIIRIVVTIECCPACTKKHKHIFAQLLDPATIMDNTAFNYMAICPVTGLAVYLYIPGKDKS